MNILFNVLLKVIFILNKFSLWYMLKSYISVLRRVYSRKRITFTYLNDASFPSTMYYGYYKINT